MILSFSSSQPLIIPKRRTRSSAIDLRPTRFPLAKFVVNMRTDE